MVSVDDILESKQRHGLAKFLEVPGNHGGEPVKHHRERVAEIVENNDVVSTLQ
jgi:hypothetical protein